MAAEGGHGVLGQGGRGSCTSLEVHIAILHTKKVGFRAFYPNKLLMYMVWISKQMKGPPQPQKICPNCISGGNSV
eukprot:7422212-Heterocapsa_arctica.AAC.1